ncbi:MFS transporter [Oharaeibacter diazotrophicus]|uniref:Putative MFS family arabinose efflux permease n=1 Tax=Oharaeibacter diazotrophicus TaxID=1920512 RepID=A0A4R6RM05_9HYPH|nr:MFS transporter [Oharaeibacter diazotrophicus]TDP87165.1 putative MFS family arabinose efflux permease [Oharaeibacter diazotrophicus]BBE70892.1 putative MFS-type transporter YcaD [Pleomorphomonas sp. SM30]GLS77641.1 MFS transporter [Oharaeibacter diazotrophicus]
MTDASTTPTSTVLSRAAVIATATMFGLTYSLAAALIALDLVARGASEIVIGANAAMHAVGVLVTATILPRIVAAFGIRKLVILALATAAAVLIAFPAAPWIWLWFPLRFLLGMSSEILFVLSETWTNSLSTEETRARSMAAYTAALSIGFASGPAILSVVGSDGVTPFAIGAVISLAAAVFVASPKVSAPAFDEPATGNPLRYMALAPVAISSTVLNAAIETAGLSFLAIYAVQLGWAESGATRLMSVMMIGAILLQLPIGWLGDKMDRIRLLAILAVTATVGALVWPLALQDETATYALLFVWGGAFVGLYTIMLTVVGSRFQGSDLVGIYAAMGLMWGVGALVGPLAAGAAMQATQHGLAFFAAAACGAFALFAIARGRGSS